MPIPSEKIMIQAVESRDTAFDGLFVYGVITTNVFCKPSCPSKAANIDNLRFFNNVTSAIESGFRACKRCNPVGETGRIDTFVELTRYIETHLDEKLTLAKLGSIAGLSPSRLQRVFKSEFGVSPKQYQDAARMRSFKQSLQHGEHVTDAIYSAGFSSISRVYGESSRNIGMTPTAYRNGGKGENIHYACRNTALGVMLMAATNKGVCSVQFGDDESSLIALLNREFPNAELTLSQAQHSCELDVWMEALDQHISRDAPKPDIPLDIKGTAFQIMVWQLLLSIKEGDVLSYGEVAEKMNNPNAVRAVGTACGKNPVGILIPCHRVLRSDGALGGYRWGLERKRALLDKERRNNSNTIE